MALLTFPGADRVLAAHAAAGLPQPDQLCGPFAARIALHAVLSDEEVPDLVALAAASGTTIWPHDVAASRPAGALLDRTGWDRLPCAASVQSAGTDAAGLSSGLDAVLGGRVVIVPIRGDDLTADTLHALLTAIAGSPQPLGVVANVRTGPIAPSGFSWDVGHFVVLGGFDPGSDEALVADTYAELGAEGMPAGCRRVTLTALAQALAASPGRGVLLLARAGAREATERLVAETGATTSLWSS